MPEPLISALIQAPFVLVMVYLVHRFLAHLTAHDRAWQERLEALTGAIDNLTDLIVLHDAATRGLPNATVHPPVVPSLDLSEVEQRRAAAARRR